MIIIKIHTDNAAFEYDANSEVARILRDLASKLEGGREPSKLMDFNGKSVGSVEYK